jgi:hypothetical protein
MDFQSRHIHIIFSLDFFSSVHVLLSPFLFIDMWLHEVKDLVNFVHLGSGFSRTQNLLETQSVFNNHGGMN